MIWIGVAAVASRLFSTAAVMLATSIHGPTWPLLTGERSPLLSWDGQAYLSIATTGYHATPIQGSHQDFAFFPAWPVLIKIATFGILPVAPVAVLLANVLFVAGLILAWHVLRSVHGDTAAFRGVLLLAFAPPAFVYSLAYSESLFLVVAAAFFLAPATSRWRPLAACVATLVRIAGTGLAIAAGVAAASHRRPEERRGDLLAIAGVLVGFGLWWAFIAVLTGDPLGFLHGALGWQPLSGLGAIAHTVHQVYGPGLLGYLFALLVLGGAVALLRYDRPTAAFAVFAVLLGILLGRDSSVARYALVAFPAFGMLGRWGGRLGGRWGFAALLAAFAAIQLLFVWFSFGTANWPP